MYPSSSSKSSSLLLLGCFLFSFDLFATSAPSNLSATAASSSQVALTWTDNSSSETGFTFAYDTDSAMGSVDDYVYAGGANTTGYTHTGRAPATTYFYKIKAEGNPDSTWTSIDSATTAPSGLTVAATSSSAIGISWTGNSGNSSIHGYTYALATNSSFSGASYNWVSGNGTTSTAKTGLATATTYWLKIKAEGTSDAYDSPYGSVVKVTTMPGSLAATVITTSQVNVSWSGNAGNTNLVGYTVATATNSSFTGATSDYVSGAGATTFSKTGLTAGTTYYFRVKAEGTSDSYDSAFTAFVTATPGTSSIPNAPSGLSASAVSGSRIDLSWTDNSGNETGFELKRATDSAFTQNVVWIGNIQGTSYSNVGLAGSTTYYYKVRAEGTGGKSSYSNTANASTGSATGGIPPHFFGINAWMPTRIGNEDKGGDLDDHWQDVQDSGVKIMRYGGIAVDRIQHDLNPNWTEVQNQYLAMVDKMRSRGIEPVLQVPYWGGTYTAQQAAALVSFINGAPHSRGVKYWSIGNEPDLDKTGYPYKPVTTTKIAGYIRSFSTAMKAVDPSIRIVGPDLTWNDPDLLDPLTTCNGTGDDITGPIPNTNPVVYYVDIIAYHAYHGFSGNQSRGDVIGKLSPSGGFQQRLGTLKTRLSGCHNRTGDNAIRIAVTETNAGHQNTNDTDDPSDLDGVDAKSFLGGQFWAETLGVSMQQGVDFVTFWSVVEGDELGYIGHDSGAKRPSYYHFQMMAKNFRGNVVTATDNRDNVKVFAAKDSDQVAVILLNQEESTDLSYTVRLDNSTITTSTLRVNVDASLSGQTSGTIERQSTIVLLFNASGTLQKTITYERYGSGVPTETP